ncbi:MAG: hypothetical protein IH587_01635 [Anaerolineae bacterium]|nr:hypothetical protein [Anaerolineae bacterium]
MNETLQTLITRWEAFARDAQSQLQQQSGDPHTRIYYQAIAQTYQRAAEELRAVAEGKTPPSDSQIPGPPAFLHMTRDQTTRLLDRAGLNITTLYMHDDGALTVVFPRLQPYSQEERLRRLCAAESRVTILDMGKLPDTGDPYIDFAIMDDQ